MADMTQKHYKLIEDAINEGIATAMYRLVDNANNIAPNLRGPMLKRTLATCLGEAFASRLAYTHDKFDGELFKRHIAG